MSFDDFEFSTLHDEFVVIGPIDGRDRILARSTKAGIDLIGFALDRDDSDDSDDEIIDNNILRIYDIFSPKGRSLHRISSWSIHGPQQSNDDRKSSYKFAWVGFCTKSDIEGIKKTFNANIVDLAQAASDTDRRQLEISIAPVLYKCARANENYKRRRRTITIILSIYIALMIIIFTESALPSIIRTLSGLK